MSAVERLSESPTSDSPSRQRLLAAAKKIRDGGLSDPYADFDHAAVAPVSGTRYTYDPVTDEWKPEAVLVKIEPTPFAKGAIRAAHRCLEESVSTRDLQTLLFSTAVDWKKSRRWVVKTFLQDQADREAELAAVRSDVRSQTLAKHYGVLYNQANPPRKVDFLEASYIEVPGPDGRLKTYAAEAYVEGQYVKYSNNSGWYDVADNRNTPHTFSHFTYVSSGGQLLIVDIQGVGDLFTDPVVHHRHSDQPAAGDLGLRGISLFLYSHQCTPLCQMLGLPAFELYSESRPRMLADWRGLTCGSFTDMLSLIHRNSQAGSSLADASADPGSPMLPSALPSPLALSTSGLAPHTHFKPIPESIPEQCLPNGHVHHMLGRLHSLGRIAQLDDMFNANQSLPPSQPDHNAAYWHFQEAAHLGNVPAMLAMARLFSGLQRDPVLEPIVTPPKPQLCLDFHILAAQRGCRPSMAFVAKAFQKGLFGFAPDWNQAVKYFLMLQETADAPLPESTDVNWDYYGYTPDAIPPSFESSAAIAEMYQEGGHGLESDLAAAFEHWNAAAEAATAAGKGRLANQYFEKSAECDC
jgi:TPR repeat protein